MPEHAFDDDLVDELSYPLPDDEALDDDEMPEVRDRDTVLRMLRSFARLEADIVQIRADADAERRRIDDWQLRRETVKVRQQVWFRQALEGWARMEAKRTGTITFDLPAGKLTLRKRAEIVAAAADLDVKKLPEHAVEVTRSLSKSKVKATCGVAGESWDAEPVDGMVAHEVVDPATGTIIPGLIWYVPGLDKAQDYRFQIKAAPVVDVTAEESS